LNKLDSISIILFVLIVEFITNFGHDILVAILFIAIFALMIFNTKKYFRFFILLFLFSDDMSRFSSHSTLGSITSIYTIPSFNMLITVFSLLTLLLIYTYHRKLFVAKEMKSLFYFNIFILCAGTVCGLSYIILYPRIAVQDASYFINPLVFMLATYLIYKDDHKYFKIFLSSIILAAAVKFLILLFLFITGNGEVVGSMVKVTGDSGKSLIGLYATVFLLLFIRTRKINRFIYLFMFLVSILLIFSIASRSSMLFILISLATAIYLLDASKIKQIAYILFSVIGLYASIVAIELLHPNAINNVLWKLGSFGEIDIHAGKYSSLSAVTRYIEVLNIFFQHLDEGTIIQGAGFGSYFTDNNVPFPFSLYDTDSYRDEWIYNRTFFKPHTTPIFLFLKIGLGGVFLYYFVYMKVFLKLKKHLPLISNGLEYSFAVAILSNILLVITKNYSSKMQIATGIFMAIAFLILRPRGFERNETS